MDRNHLLALILAGAGLFSIAGAVLDWEWFMTNRKAAFWVKRFGRNGARIFYGILGAAITTLGILLATGVLAMRK